MKRVLAPVLVLGALGLASLPATAATYWLCAKSFMMAMPDTTMVPMWGFALSDENFADNCDGTATVPGPKLTAPSGESLTIHLRNDLDTGGPAIVEPVSIVIPGQAMPTDSTPEFFDDGEGRQRVFSFTQSTPADATTVQTYTWNNLQPGTYLYESGTHPQVQVQMGLYGAVTKDSAAGIAYSGVPYTEERDLFYSEVDPALHAAVNAGTFSGSTLDYVPKYFLLQTYDSNTNLPVDVSIDTGTIPPDCIDSGIGQGDRLLLRLFNAGLRELAPMLIGSHFDLVAEGGKPYPFARTQYQTLLMPGSTKDAVFTPEYEADFKVIERRLNLTDAAASGGGMQTCISVAGVANSAPTVSITAPADGSSFSFGASVNFMGTANDAEDGGISGSLSWTSSIDGSIGSGDSFMTSALSAGVHTITASVTDSGGLPGSDSIIVTVNLPGNDPEVTITAPADASVYTEGDSISFAGTATDAEDDDTVLTAALNWNSSIDGDFGTGGSVMTSSLSAGTHTITASVTDSDGRTGSNSITVTVNAAGNTAPVVTITNPSDGATFTQIDSIPFTGTATDVEDDDTTLTAALSWTSSIDSPPDIGSGGSFSTTLSIGTHTITASVTDTGIPPLEGSDSITVNIVAANADTLTCKKADYKPQPDSLAIEVLSDDLPKGNRIITGVIDIDGDGFDGADDYDVGTIPVKNPGSDVYRTVIQPDPDPTEGTSVLKATSDLGGECTITVN
jgi:hypothetical protein